MLFKYCQQFFSNNSTFVFCLTRQRCIEFWLYTFQTTLSNVVHSKVLSRQGDDRHHFVAELVCWKECLSRLFLTSVLTYFFFANRNKQTWQKCVIHCFAYNMYEHFKWERCSGSEDQVKKLLSFKSLMLFLVHVMELHWCCSAPFPHVFVVQNHTGIIPCIINVWFRKCASAARSTLASPWTPM